MRASERFYSPPASSASGRFAGDAKVAERLKFSFAVERTAKEKYSQSNCKKKNIIEKLSASNRILSFPTGLRILAFRPLSGKLKNISFAFSAALR
jgi:hypothetical protein